MSMAASVPRLIEVMSRLVSERGAPTFLRTDNGQEFVSKALLSWIVAQGMDIALIEPGKPSQNLEAAVHRASAPRPVAETVPHGTNRSQQRKPSHKLTVVRKNGQVSPFSANSLFENRKVPCSSKRIPCSVLGGTLLKLLNLLT